ncbi:MAG TPA: phosphodiesterase, partial [Candidatus Acetothermia bacterium]|nr:phosphodiesterase [Candidatus Acetothermia bacterium]
MMDRLEVLIVGWDGADPGWLEQHTGELSTFAELKARGRWGRVESTIPPVTAPAWASFHTGANPGRHGVFGWATRRPGSYLPGLANAGSMALPTLWELLSGGIRVGVVGFPLTHPAREVNGFWLPGLLSPKEAEGHPPGLVREVLARFPAWRPTPPEWARGEDPGRWSQELAAATS